MSGFTKIDNEVLEALSRADLTSLEFRLAFHALRSTNGWEDKQSDTGRRLYFSASYSELSEHLGISLGGIRKAVPGLLRKKVLLEKSGPTGATRRTYRFNHNVTVWAGKQSQEKPSIPTGVPFFENDARPDTGTASYTTDGTQERDFSCTTDGVQESGSCTTDGVQRVLRTGYKRVLRTGYKSTSEDEPQTLDVTGLEPRPAEPLKKDLKESIKEKHTQRKSGGCVDLDSFSPEEKSLERDIIKSIQMVFYPVETEEEVSRRASQKVRAFVQSYPGHLTEARNAARAEINSLKAANEHSLQAGKSSTIHPAAVILNLAVQRLRSEGIAPMRKAQ